MEHKIAIARDEQIDKFKNKMMTIEKDAAIDDLSKDHTNKIMVLKKDRDQKIKDIKLKFSEEIYRLKMKVNIKKTEIEKES